MELPNDGDDYISEPDIDQEQKYVSNVNGTTVAPQGIDQLSDNESVASTDEPDAVSDTTSEYMSEDEFFRANNLSQYVRMSMIMILLLILMVLSVLMGLVW